MTRSMGARARQHRREELFSAELTLRRVQLHLRNQNEDALSPRWRRPLIEAMELVHVAYCAVLDEQLTQNLAAIGDGD